MIFHNVNHPVMLVIRLLKLKGNTNGCSMYRCLGQNLAITCREMPALGQYYFILTRRACPYSSYSVQLDSLMVKAVFLRSTIVVNPVIIFEHGAYPIT